MKKIHVILAAAMAMATVSVLPANATDVSVNSGEGSNTLVTATAAPIVAAQVAGTVSANVVGSIVVAPTPVVTPIGPAPVAPTPGVTPGAPTTSGFLELPAGSTQFKAFNLRQEMAMKGGQAAANDAKGINTWLSGAYTKIKSTDKGGEFDGPALSASFGLDRRFGDKTTLGFTLGYENVDIDTTFNRGFLQADGYSVGPYIAYSLNNTWSLFGMASYTWVSYDVKSGTANTTGSFDAERMVGVAGLSGNFRKGNWLIGPQAGVMWMSEEQDAYRDSKGTAVQGGVIPLTRWNAGGTLGYDFGKISPYVKLVGEYDSSHSAAVDLGSGVKSSNTREGAQAGVGINFNFGRGLTGNLEGSYNSLGRENLEIYAFKGRIALEF